MKKKMVILGVAIAALTLGSATFAITNNINKEASPLDAEAYNDNTSVQNGLSVKVTDVSSIQNEEDLLFLYDPFLKANDPYKYLYSPIVVFLKIL